MQILQVPINKLKPDKNQPRKSFNPDRLEELAESIRTTGIINPIEIDKNFVIITGEYRWRASKLAGLKDVPCKVIELPADQRFLLQMIENIQHTEMTPWDTAQAIKRMLATMLPGNKVHTPKKGITAEKCITQLSKQIGKSNSFIIEHLKLLKSSEPIKLAVRSGELPLTNIRAIYRVAEPFKKAMEKKMLAGEFKSRDGGHAVAIAINQNPDKAKEILSKNYSKYKSTPEVQEALSHIVPRLSDQFRESIKPSEKLADILLDLSKWLDENKPETVGSFHLKRMIMDLVMAKQEIQEWLDNKKVLKG